MLKEDFQKLAETKLNGYVNVHAEVTVFVQEQTLKAGIQQVAGVNEQV